MRAGALLAFALVAVVVWYVWADSRRRASAQASARPHPMMASDVAYATYGPTDPYDAQVRSLADQVATLTAQVGYIGARGVAQGASGAIGGATEGLGAPPVVKPEETAPLMSNATQTATAAGGVGASIVGGGGGAFVGGLIPSIASGFGDAFGSGFKNLYEKFNAPGGLFTFADAFGIPGGRGK